MKDYSAEKTEDLLRLTAAYLAHLPVQRQNVKDMIAAELSAIEVELDTRAPDCEFVGLLGENGEWVGFEPMVR